jgi:hypothetical protein
MYNEPSSTENWDKRYYGIYRGVVVDTADPDNRGRITLQVPQILGTAVTGWAWPIIGGYTPIPGDGCWVMFEGGDPNFPLWLGAY